MTTLAFELSDWLHVRMFSQTPALAQYSSGQWFTAMFSLWICAYVLHMLYRVTK